MCWGQLVESVPAEHRPDVVLNLSRYRCRVDFKVPEDEWDDGAFIEDPDGIRPGISFLKVPEGKHDEPRIGFHLGTAGIQRPVE